MAAYACQTRTVQSGSADRSETSCRSPGNYWQSQAVCGSEEDRCDRFDPCNELGLLVGGDAGGSPDVAPAPAGVPSSGWWDRLAAVTEGAWGVAGDALNLRGDEALLDAQEELAAFRASTFAPLIDHQPSSGYGMFDVGFDPASGQLLITLKVAYEFVDGDPAVSSPGIPASELRWTGAVPGGAPLCRRGRPSRTPFHAPPGVPRCAARRSRRGRVRRSEVVVGAGGSGVGYVPVRRRRIRWAASHAA